MLIPATLVTDSHRIFQFNCSHDTFRKTLGNGADPKTHIRFLVTRIPCVRKKSTIVWSDNAFKGDWLTEDCRCIGKFEQP